MKKLSKIVLGSILSVAMLVTGGLAAVTMNNAYAKSSVTVGGRTISATTSNALVDYAKYSYTPNTNKQWTTNGVELTGGAGATFDLGTIDISKGSWIGTETTVTGDYTSFIDFWYLPSVSKLGAMATELTQFTITLTDTTDANNYMNVFVYAISNDVSNHVMYFRAQASGQSKAGAFRNTIGLIVPDSYVTKNGILKSTNEATRRGTETQNVFPTGVQSQGISLVYSNTTNTLYSPVTFTDATNNLSSSFAIRNFSETYSGTDTTWSGFKDNLVNVSIKFDSLKSGTTSTSLVISSLGGEDFNAAKDGEAEVVSGATSNSAADKITFGTYTQIAGRSYTGVRLTGAAGSTFDLGTMSINDTYFNSSVWSYTKGTGITCTKMLGAVFTGSDEAFEHKTSDTRSFISLVFDPHSKTDTREITTLEVTLTEVNNPSNFVTYVIDKTGPYSDTVWKYEETLIKCKATNNATAQAERYNTNGIVANKDVRRVINTTGSQTVPISLFYDYSQQAAFTNVAYNSGIGTGIGGAFKIRDFDSDPSTDTNYDSNNCTNINYWAGFSENATVNISVKFTGVASGVDETSIVLTSLAGNDFNNVALTGTENKGVLANHEYSLNDFVYYQTDSVAYAYNGSYIDKYVVKQGANSETLTTTNTYTFTSGSYEIEYYSGDSKVATATVTVSDITLNVNFTASGKTDRYLNSVIGSYDVLRGEASVKNETVQIGDVIVLTPPNEKYTQLLLSDIRTLKFNNTNYSYGNNDMPFTWDAENNRFTYTIDVADLNGAALDIDVTFDRYCDVEFTDSKSDTNKIKSITGEFTNYFWTMTDSFTFNYKAGGLVTDSIRIGYARTDGQYSLDTDNRLYYNNKYIGNQDFDTLGDNTSIPGSTDKIKKAYVIVPGMKFEALYIKYNIKYDIKLNYKQNGEINDDYSGLRFVVEFEKESFDKYLECVGEENAMIIRNYITTEGQIEAGGKKTDISKITVGDWLTNSGWNDSTTTVNALGLKWVGENGTAVEGTASYAKVDVRANTSNMLDAKNYSDSDTHYAFAVTVSNLKDESVTKALKFVYMPVFTVNYVMGASSYNFETAMVKTIRDVAAELYDKNLSTEQGSHQFTVKDAAGTTYYSDLSLNALNWLASKTNGTKTELLANDTTNA